MDFPLTKQAQVRETAAMLEAVAHAGVTLVGTTNLTQAYRKANLSLYQFELQNFTNGVFVAVKAGGSAVADETGTVEIWGYPIKGGAAQFFGTYTFTIGAATDDNGLLYVDAFVESVAGQHTCTILNITNGAAVLKFDTLGLKYIVAYYTAFVATGTTGTLTTELRPW